MNNTELLNARCVLFVSGEPVLIEELCKLFDVTMLEMTSMLSQASKLYEEQDRGVLLHITEESVQLVSNKSTQSMWRSFCSLRSRAHSLRLYSKR